MNAQTHAFTVSCETFEIHFDDFDELPAVKGRDWTDSAQFDCFGHQWCVRIYPGGQTNSDDGMVSVFLRQCSSGSIRVQPTFIVHDRETAPAAYYQPPYLSARRGTPNFADRSAILGACPTGDLVIEVQLKQTGPSTLSPPPFVPTNPLHKNILKKFMDEESSDVIFEVSRDEVEEGGRVEEGGSRKRKRDEVPSTTFHAHRFVLLDNAPALAEACESSSDLTPIPITGVSPEIFRHVLYCAYGGDVTDVVLKYHAKDIIDVADKFGVVGLKLKAEAYWVENTTISIDNVMENLLYADAKNCPLLKEAVMDFVVENATEVVRKVNLKDAPRCLLTDVLAAMNSRDNRLTEAEILAEGVSFHDMPDDVDFRFLRVSELRKQLDEKGLEVDGSREAMIAALDAYKSRRSSFGYSDLSSSSSDEEEG
ncbi:hypothetical protein ACHAXT_007536 [Thalassiosira profunda]